MGRGGARRAVLRLGAQAAVLLALLPGLAMLAAPPARADPSAKDWARLRACESSGRYDVVATHKHDGAYQFDLSTWRSVGGEGLPSAASVEEQDHAAPDCTGCPWASSKRRSPRRPRLPRPSAAGCDALSAAFCATGWRVGACQASPRSGRTRGL